MKFAVIGDPIEHSLSPRMHRAAYAALGLPHTYDAVRVSLNQVDVELDRLAAACFTGVNVTVPLKEAAYRWSAPDDFAARCGAVNTIRFSDRAGVNTDGPGMTNLVASRFGQVEGVAVLLLGAGGSARAIAQALHDAGARVAIWNRTQAKADALASAVGCEADESPNLSRFDLIVNATSSSMAGVLPEIVESQLVTQPRAGSAAIDLYYTKGQTVFQSALAQGGWDIWDGRELLVAQGALAFQFWLGLEPPVEAMRAAVGL